MLLSTSDASHFVASAGGWGTALDNLKVDGAWTFAGVLRVHLGDFLDKQVRLITCLSLDISKCIEKD